MPRTCSLGGVNCHLREQLDLPAVDVAENQRPRYSRHGIGAEFGLDAEIFRAASADVPEFDIGGDLECHGLAGGSRILLQNQREFAGLRGEQRATGLPFDNAETDDPLIIFDLLLDIGGREGRVPDAFDLIIVLFNPQTIPVRPRPAS